MNFTLLSLKPGIAAGTLCLSLLPLLSAGVRDQSGPPPRTNRARVDQPGEFIANRGQWDAQAEFLARTRGANVWFTQTGVVYDLYRVDDSRLKVADFPHNQQSTISNQRFRRGHVVKMEFVGGKRSPVKGDGLLQGRYNYFVGRDKSKWASNVPRFAEARSEQIYDGVEARWYFDQGSHRYDLIVAPGADPGKIRMRFDGANSVVSNGRTLRLGTSLGDVEQGSLFAYQKVAGGTRQVPCSFRAVSNVVTFSVGAYDAAKPLVIDPILWSTEIGPSGAELRSDQGLDSAGNVVIASDTEGAYFPTTVGAYDVSLNGARDTLVVKMSADGSTMLYSTFIGGTLNDFCGSMVLDASENAVVAGWTVSTDFPTTAGAYDTIRGAQGADAFVAKLSADGSALLYGGLVGGAYDETCNGIVLDSSGNIVVAGSTLSDDFPVTAGAYDASYAETQPGVGVDSYVAKLSADGSSLLMGTYLGGEGADIINALDTDSSENLVVVGSTEAADFPTTPGAFDTTYNGEMDAFAARLSADGSTLQWATFVGAAADEDCWGVAIDGSDNPVLGGYTYSSTFPVTAGAYDTGFSGGWDGSANDAFVLKLAADGSSLLSSTFLGGDAYELIFDVDFDGAGNILVAGSSTSRSFPATPPGEPDYSGFEDWDVAVARFDAGLSGLQYSARLGPSTWHDFGCAINLDASGDAIVSGKVWTYSMLAMKLRLPRYLKLFTLPQTKVVGGFSLPCTVTLDAAPAKDVHVNITSNNPNKITRPPFVIIRAGKTYRTFNLKTYTVLVETVCTATASYGGVSKTETLTLKVGGLQAFKIQPSTLVGGAGATGTVIVSAPAPPGGRSVALASDSVLVQVPASVLIPAGLTSATFPITTFAVSSPTPVNVEATLGVVTKQLTMTLNP